MAGLPPDQLAAWFGFTAEELACNRAGRLSPRQRQDVLFLSIGYLVRGLVMLTACGLLLASVAPTATRRWQQVVLAVTGALVVVLAGIWGWAAWQVWHPAVHAVTGTVRRAGSLQRPGIEAGGILIRVATRRWKRLPATLSGVYRVYYGPNNRLLSIEPVHKEDRS